MWSNSSFVGGFVVTNWLFTPGGNCVLLWVCTYCYVFIGSNSIKLYCVEPLFFALLLPCFDRCTTFSVLKMLLLAEFNVEKSFTFSDGGKYWVIKAPLPLRKLYEFEASPFWLARRSARTSEFGCKEVLKLDELHYLLSFLRMSVRCLNSCYCLTSLSVKFCFGWLGFLLVSKLIKPCGTPLSLTSLKLDSIPKILLRVCAKLCLAECLSLLLSFMARPLVWKS